MDLGRYKSKTISNKDLKEPVMASSTEKGTSQLTFTFVPAIGTLPSQVLVGKDELPKILLGPEVTVTQKAAECERNSEINPHQPSESFLDVFHKQRSGDSFSKEVAASNSLEEIKHNDLFIAKFVVVMDSDDGEDEKITKKKKGAKDNEFIRAQQSTIAQPKAALVEAYANELNDPKDLHQFSPYLGHQELQSYKIKSSYKSFAAIPTNTLLRDQKAIDKPEINSTNASKENLDPHQEMCSPALLRQQTEEICAAIDEVLHDDPLPMHCKAASKPAIRKKDSKSVSILRSPQKSAGRETKYASIQQLANTRTNNQQKTRPGVIRPISLKISAMETMDGHVSSFDFQQFSTPHYRKET
ncbi:muscular LMNA-interacting protein isoform X2 [Lithobates pipiens]